MQRMGVNWLAAAIGVFCLSVLLAMGSTAASSSSSFTPWDDAVFTYVDDKYGPLAERRMRKLHEIIAKNYDAPIEQKLQVTNYALNHLPWIADQQKYRVDDYWATPLETIATFGGDCEDIAIAKWVVLRHMGVPSEHLRLALVQIKSNSEHHMILLYVVDPSLPVKRQRSLVLDNYDKQIKAGIERTDLKAIYIIDSDSNAVVFGEDHGHRTIEKEIDNAKHGKLAKIQQKLLESASEYQELNGGRPFF